MSLVIALLRGINVGGRNQIRMPELRSLCADLGWESVQSYIQSGNLLFQAVAPTPDLETALEQAIAHRFGLSIPVIMRTAVAWSAYVDSNPFPQASQREANLVMLALSKTPPAADAVDRLRERASDEERITQSGDALWIHYGAGAGKSKLAPSLLDRFVGSPVTTRNWRTVLKLNELATGP